MVPFVPANRSVEGLVDQVTALVDNKYAADLLAQAIRSYMQGHVITPIPKCSETLPLFPSIRS